MRIKYQENKIFKLYGTYRSAENLNRRFTTFGFTKGQHYYGYVNVERLKAKANGYAGVASSDLQKGNISDTGTSDGQGTGDNAGTGLMISLANDWNRKLRYLCCICLLVNIRLKRPSSSLTWRDVRQERGE